MTGIGRWLGACGLAVLTNWGAALAQSGAPPEELSINLTSNLFTPAFMTFLGKNGQPSVEVLNAPRSFGEIAKQQCGAVPDSFGVALAAANPGLDLGTELTAIVPGGSTVNVPPCPPSAAFTLAKVSAPKDSNPYPFYRQDSLGLQRFSQDMTDEDAFADWLVSLVQNDVGDAGPPGPVGVVDPSRYRPLEHTQVTMKQFGTSDYQTLFDSLNKSWTEANPSSSDVVVPVSSSQWFSIPLKPEAEAAIALLDPVQLSDAIGAPVDDYTIAQTFQPVDEPTDPADCIAQSYQDGAAATEALTQVLAENAGSLAASDGPKDTQVLILDSGFYKKGGLPLPAGAIEEQPWPEGASFEPYSSMAPKDNHGTKVGILALGGVPLSDYVRALGYRVNLRPVRIFAEKRTPKYDAEHRPIVVEGVQQFTLEFPVDQDTVFSQLAGTGASVINLSFGRRDPAPQILSAIKQGKALFVVAAGNDGASLEGDGNPVYPARYGGYGHDGQANVLTVASVDGALALAKHSNYGPSYVEIAAPGCLVPTIGFNPQDGSYTDAPSTGTSFAAPQVTATAALLKSTLPGLTAADLKLRILAGADIVPELVAAIDNGRVLNPVKTLAVFQDVVQLAHAVGDLPAGTLLRGKLAMPIAVSDICEGGALPSGRLMKVVPGFDGDAPAADRALLYVRDQDGFLARKDCRMKPGTTLSLVLSHHGPARTIGLADVADFIPAMRAP